MTTYRDLIEQARKVALRTTSVPYLTTAVAHAGCGYLAAENSVCNQCGQYIAPYVKVQDRLNTALSLAGELAEALQVFGRMADGKDKWLAHESCAVFPTMEQVRKARAALVLLDKEAP